MIRQRRAVVIIDAQAAGRIAAAAGNSGPIHAPTRSGSSQAVTLFTDRAMNINAIEMSEAARVSDTTLCHACAERRLCLAGPESRSTGLPVHRRFKVARGQALLLPGDAAGDRLYVVHSGALKVYARDERGKDTIVRFPIRGDIVGFEHAGGGCHSYGVTALDDSYLCEVRLHDALAAGPLLYQVLSHEIAREQKLCTRLRQGRANRRIATFLLATGARLSRRGFSATRYRLPMARTDIANHLGLTPECVSRSLLWFCQSGLLELNGREVRMLDAAALQALTEWTDYQAMAPVRIARGQDSADEPAAPAAGYCYG